MNIEKRVLKLVFKDRNCAQVVLAAMEEETGMDEKTACAITAALGGGVRSGEICGAVTGAALVFGLIAAQDGYGRSGGTVAKMQKEFNKRFTEKFGKLRCEEFLENDPGKKLCFGYINYAAQETEKIVKEYYEGKYTKEGEAKK